jgi:predicted N-acyltransferase
MVQLQMNFEVLVAHSVNDIPADLWDSLNGGQAFASHGWYSFAEKILTEDYPVYILLMQRNQPVARATFWLMRHEPMPTPSRIVRGISETFFRRWPLLMCRSPLSSASGLILPAGHLRQTALNTITEMAQNIGRKYGASFIVYDYLDASEAQRFSWPSGFCPYQVPDPGTRLLLEWPDFERYIKSLSKSMQKDYRRHCNRAAELGIRMSFEKHVSDLDDAMRLIHNVERHHNSAPFPYTRQFLEHAPLVNSTWITARVGETLVGCGLLIGDGDTRFLAALGLDYDVKYTYFQMLYGAISQAIEEGVKVLRGGGGAYETKARLGFQMESNNQIVFRVSNPALRWAVNRLIAAS